MPAIADRDLLSQPATTPGAINRRLRWAREDAGLSQRAWRAKLIDVGYDISPASVSDYEVWMSRADRQIKLPPVDYLTRVCVVFGYRLDWLILGSGNAKEDPDDPNLEEQPDTLFESQRFGALASRLGEIHWARGSARPGLLRLLADAERAADPATVERSMDQLTRFLGDVVPSESASFMTLLELPPREREHVALHVRGLVYLLFRPFRDADLSYVWSKALGRGGRGRSTAVVAKASRRTKETKAPRRRRRRD